MPERHEKLQALLGELEKELHELDTLDDQTRGVLQEAVGEIETILQPDAPATDQPEGLAEKLQDAATDFESSHPTLGGIVERVINVLGQMGI